MEERITKEELLERLFHDDYDFALNISNTDKG